MSVRAWVSTGAGSRSAIACIELAGEGLDTACAEAGLRLPEVGTMGLRDLAGIDEGVVVRWSEDLATVMPHGSPVIVDALVDALGGTSNRVTTIDRYPEADSLVEACALEALSRTRSPRASDVVLGQVPLWERHAAGGVSDEQARELQRLIDPAIVVAVGPANVGKSTLLNALASRSLAVVSPEAGTTRDGVTALLELDGIAVRWVDTPGVRTGADDVERRAMEAVGAVVRRADLVVHCADASTGWLDDLGVPETSVLRCATRGDLGRLEGAEVSTSAGSGGGGGGGVGIDELARRVRERLVPDATLEAARGLRWAFSPSLAPAEDVG